MGRLPLQKIFRRRMNVGGRNGYRVESPLPCLKVCFCAHLGSSGGIVRFFPSMKADFRGL